MTKRLKTTATMPLAVCAILALDPAAAFAQAPPSPATPPAPTASAPSAAPSAAHCQPGAGTPKNAETTTGQAAQPLGDQLAKTDGVLCPPPDVDPEIRAPTPGGGNMPVIPPPGSPGGDPNLRPK